MTAVWTELQFEVATEAAELVASAIAEVAGGVEVRDAGTLIRADPGRVLIVAQCAAGEVDAVLESVAETCERARASGFDLETPRASRREAHEDEWRDVWKRYFRATRVGRTFLVRPSWDPGSAGAADRIIDIDPGRAFGTGGHASTRLCIVLAEEIESRRVGSFLDLGCGSGILSVAAARLWPSAAGLAMDVDAEAAACAQENLARNNIGTVQTGVGALEQTPADRPFDLILANIQADVLIPLAPTLASRLGEGGAAILSGLLQGDAARLIDAYRATGLGVEARRDEEEWTALRLGRA